MPAILAGEARLMRPTSIQDAQQLVDKDWSDLRTLQLAGGHYILIHFRSSVCLPGHGTLG
jgi:hypothetical protein